MPFASGEAALPIPIEPGLPVDVTVHLDRKMPNDKYDVSLVKNTALLNADAHVTVTAQTSSTVALRVVVEHGLAGAGAVFVICS